MELELGLKITRDADEQSSTNFRISKDRAGPVFMSTETDSVFILSAHVKGFEWENIKININEDGSRITISGEKLVRETIMRGWRVYKEEEVRGFRKTFKIPDGVVLDHIKTKFGAERSSLTIYMPKSEKGIRGLGIEEVKEEEDTEGGYEKEELMKSPEEKHEDEQLQKIESKKELQPERKIDAEKKHHLKQLKKQPDEAEREAEEAKKSQVSPKAEPQVQEAKPGAEVEGSDLQKKLSPQDQEAQKHESGEVMDLGGSQLTEKRKQGIESEIQEVSTDQAESSIQKEGKEGERPERQSAPHQMPVEEKKSGFFAPGFFTGSALVASLLVLLVGLSRSKRH